MTRVWIVWYTDYTSNGEPNHLDSCWSTKELAEERAGYLKHYGKLGVFLETIEVDELRIEI